MHFEINLCQTTKITRGREKAFVYFWCVKSENNINYSTSDSCKQWIKRKILISSYVVEYGQVDINFLNPRPPKTPNPTWITNAKPGPGELNKQTIIRLTFSVHIKHQAHGTINELIPNNLPKTLFSISYDLKTC